MFRLFEHLPDAQLALLLQLCHYEPFEEKRLVYTEGEASEDFFVIVAGAVEAFRNTMVGKQTVARLRVGQIFGEDSFFDGKPRSSTVVGTQPGLLLRLEARQVREIMKQVREFDVSLLRSFWYALAAKVRQANGFMSEIAAVGREIPERGSREQGTTVEVRPSDKVDVFQEKGLSSAGLRLLATTLPAERFPPEAMIFFEGELGDCLYIVVEGEVRISRRLQGIGEEALTILGRGEVFGEMALIDELPRSADARSHSNGCTLLRLNRHDLDELLSVQGAAASFLEMLCEILCRRYRAMINLLVTWRVMAGFS